MASRRCPARYCPRILTRGVRYCPEHQAQYEAKRGTPEQRGYGAQHKALRKTWQARLNKGELVRCARCGEQVRPSDAWALDHDDNDRTHYLGPSHARCNDAAGGRASHN